MPMRALARDAVQVKINRLLGSAIEAKLAMGKHDSAMAEVLNCCQVMGDEQDSTAAPAHIAHFPDALFLERHVAHRQHLIDNQDLGVQVRRHREGKPDVHPAGIILNGSIQKFLNF